MFCENLKQARKKAGLSQEELANELHVTRQAVTKWESGENEPSLESVNQLAEILQVSVAYLMGGEEAKTSPIKTTRFFRWGNFLRVVALALAFMAIFFLFLPGVSGQNRPYAYAFIFGTGSILINPMALIAWILLLAAFVAFVAFFFVNPDRRIKKILLWSLLTCLLIAGVLFLSCHCLNPRSLAGPYRGADDEGVDPSIGLGVSFLPDQLDDLAAAFAKEELCPESDIENIKMVIISNYTLIDGVYYYNHSRAYYTMIYARTTYLGSGFIVSGILCLVASLVGAATFWIKNKPIHLSGDIQGGANPKTK